MDIKNIIFDYGGVILNINTDLIAVKLHEIGEKDVMALHKKLVEKDIYNKLETGEISDREFIEAIRGSMSVPATDQQIIDAWNALILDMPEKRIKMLQEVKENYRIFLLSNTNIIHYEHYRAQLENKFGFRSFDKIFEKAYFSHRLGMRKPGREIFDHVLKDADIEATESLFIDDTFINVEGASIAGMAGFYLRDGIDVTDVFSEGKLSIDLSEVIQQA